MSNKTAMQELIHWLKSGWKDEDIDTVLKKAEQLLEVEKEKIENAYLDGFKHGKYEVDAIKFYSETYK